MTETENMKKLMILVTNLPVTFASKCSATRRMSRDMLKLNTREKEDLIALTVRNLLRQAFH